MTVCSLFLAFFLIKYPHSLRSISTSAVNSFRLTLVLGGDIGRDVGEVDNVVGVEGVDRNIGELVRVGRVEKGLGELRVGRIGKGL